MKTKLFYYYPPSEELWEKAIFVFDTNVLLDLYRYSESSREDLLKVIEKLSKDKRVFIPFQVAIEYQRRRIAEISSQEKIYSTKKTEITGELNALKNRFNDLKKFEEKTKKKIDEKINDTEKFLLSKIVEYEVKHPKLMEADFIRDKLTELLDDFVGDEPDNDHLQKIYNDGKSRYDKNIPPGFLDIKKPEPNRYGDLIIWEEMIAYSIKEEKPIIFITRDVKDDWWLNHSGKTISPRIELLKEFKERTKNDFYMYQTFNFLGYAKNNFGLEIEESSVQEIEEIEDYFQEQDDVLLDNFMRNIEPIINKKLQKKYPKGMYKFSYDVYFHSKIKADVFIFLNDLNVFNLIVNINPQKYNISIGRTLYFLDKNEVFKKESMNRVAHHLITYINEFIEDNKLFFDDDYNTIYEDDE